MRSMILIRAAGIPREKALFGGLSPRSHRQVLFCRSRMSAARNLAASPPVTQR